MVFQPELAVSYDEKYREENWNDGDWLFQSAELGVADVQGEITNDILERSQEIPPFWRPVAV